MSYKNVSLHRRGFDRYEGLHHCVVIGVYIAVLLMHVTDVLIDRLHHIRFSDKRTDFAFLKQSVLSESARVW